MGKSVHGIESEDLLVNSESINPNFDWEKILKLIFTSRAIDDIEETILVPQGKVLYQFSARGHDMGQILLGTLLTHQHDAVSAYYRSRPMLLTLGLSSEDAIAGPLAKSGGFSDGRDIGVVCNLPSRPGPICLPMSGDVGSQFTPSAGWAQAIEYRRKVLKETEYEGAIAVVLAGEGAVATNGFWSSLTIATTLSLPLLFYIEDNAYAISVPGDKQTPNSNIAQNLAAFGNLHIMDCDGTEPDEASENLFEAVQHVRARQGPVLIRLEVPRLSGHSAQDTQAYKGQELIEEEKRNDPLDKLYRYLAPTSLSELDWDQLKADVEQEVNTALEGALSRPEPDKATVGRYVY